MLKGRRIKRNEKLCVIGVEVMVYRVTGDKVTERCGVKNEENWTKDRALWNTVRRWMRRRDRAGAVDRESA